MQPDVQVSRTCTALNRGSSGCKRSQIHFARTSGGVLEPRDLVEVVVVEVLLERLERGLDVAEVLDPAVSSPTGAGDVDLNPVGVAVQSRSTCGRRARSEGGAPPRR